MANSTPDTPDVSETKLAALKMDQLRAHARKLGIDGAGDERVIREDPPGY